MLSMQDEELWLNLRQELTLPFLIIWWLEGGVNFPQQANQQDNNVECCVGVSATHSGPCKRQEGYEMNRPLSTGKSKHRKEGSSVRGPWPCLPGPKVTEPKQGEFGLEHRVHPVEDWGQVQWDRSRKMGHLRDLTNLFQVLSTTGNSLQEDSGNSFIVGWAAFILW